MLWRGLGMVFVLGCATACNEQEGTQPQDCEDAREELSWEENTSKGTSFQSFVWRIGGTNLPIDIPDDRDNDATHSRVKAAQVLEVAELPSLTIRKPEDRTPYQIQDGTCDAPLIHTYVPLDMQLNWPDDARWSTTVNLQDMDEGWKGVQTYADLDEVSTLTKIRAYPPADAEQQDVGAEMRVIVSEAEDVEVQLLLHRENTDPQGASNAEGYETIDWFTFTVEEI